MKVGDKVKIREGRRGRPRHGVILEFLSRPTEDETLDEEARVVTTNGPEIFWKSELEVINKENG